MNLADGEYGSDTEYSNLSLRSYTGSNTIVIQGNSQDYSKVVIHHHVELNNSVSYQFRNLTIQTVIPSNRMTNFGLVFIAKGMMNFYNCCLDVTRVENSANDAQRYIFQVANYGHLRVYASNDSNLKSGIYIKANPEQQYRCITMMANTGKIEFTADVTFLTSFNTNRPFVNGTMLSTISFGRSVYPDPGRACLVNVPEGLTVTGTRYSISANSSCNVRGRGPEFFPGNAEGTVATGGQYY